MRKTSSTARTRVLQSTPAPGPSVKFVDQIVREAPGDISFCYFSWSRAIFGRYDVFHVHWPEFLVATSSRRLKPIKRVLFRVLMFRLRARRTPVVRTVHNLRPHRESERTEAQLLDAFDRLVTVYVVMNECNRADVDGTSIHIPHGDFRRVFEDLPASEATPGRVILFGRIHPYKGAVELLRAAEEILDPEVEVRIVGAPTTAVADDLDRELSKSRSGSARISTDLRAVSDAEMVAEITSASVVALPYTDAGNGNSGVALVALSLGRPVLVPRSHIMEELAASVGERWVQFIDGPLTGLHITTALDHVSEIPQDSLPNLDSRDWGSTASAYAEVYRSLTSRRQ